MTENDGYLIDDREVYETLISPVCGNCKHLNIGTRQCTAFDQIPDEIWEGKNKHLSSYPGDGGIIYEKFRFGQ